MHQERVVQELNYLSEVCRASSEGFRKAAAEVDNKEYQELFLFTSRVRAGFALELQDQLRKRGLPQRTDRHFGAKLHRTWMTIRHQMNPHNDDIVLRECCRGEQYAIKAYEDAFEKQFLTEFQPMMDEQFVTMLEMRNMLQEQVFCTKEPKTLLHL